MNIFKRYYAGFQALDPPVA